MSQITSGVGLITGVPIEETVNKLIAISGRSRDLLVQRGQSLVAEQSAVDQLASLTLSLQFSVNKLKSPSTYSAAKATSSDESKLTASVAAGASPTPGSTSIRPVRTATSHQLLSASFSDLSAGLGQGKLNLRVGGHVDPSVLLADLNGGAGVKLGRIRLTDRSGESATIDLRTARTVEDVLEAINASTDVSVQASVSGDSIQLTDTSGGSGTLGVAEVGGGTTAAGLGLVGVTPSGATLTGADIYRLNNSTRLGTLNDGRGVDQRGEGIDELDIRLADGTTLLVDIDGATTLGGVLEKINASAPTKVRASVAEDGQRIELRDLTTGSSTFLVQNVGVGAAADDLGIAGVGSAGLISGDRLIGGLKDTLVSSLKGGQGLNLGRITVTNRGGAAATIDLAAAETLSEAIDTINDANAGVRASINASRSGIQIVDTTGGDGPLVIADADSTSTATALKIKIDANIDRVNSGSLDRQVAARNTKLTALNGGLGVPLGSIRITDSGGRTSSVDLNQANNPAETLGDVIDRINSLSVGVEASINATGDGLLLTDTARGGGKLTVAEVGGNKTAAGLRIGGASAATDSAGRQVIDGKTNYEFDLSDLTESAEAATLAELRNGAGIDLGVFRVTASSGKSFVVNLGETGSEAFTVGDVIEKINTAAASAGVAVTASLGNNGTALKLVDRARGGAELKVEDLGSGTAAAELGIETTSGAASSARERTIVGASLIDSATSDQGALKSLADKINRTQAGFTASVFEDGDGFRLALQSVKTGAANELLFDGGESDLGLEVTVKAGDALALVGSANGSGGVLLASGSNTFDGAIPGVELTVNQPSESSVTIEVTNDSDPLVAAVEDFVKSYNSIRSNLDKAASFDATNNTTGVLFGRGEVVRVDSELSRVATGSFSGLGRFASLQSIGVSIGSDGKLSLDKAKLNDAIEKSAEDVERLLSDDQRGVAAKFTDAIDRLAGDDNSLLLARSQALTASIDSTESRVEQWEARLSRQREKLLLNFYRLEDTIAKLQTNLSSLSNIRPITS